MNNELFHSHESEDRTNLEQAELLQELKKVKSAEQRVKLFAQILDKKGVDVLLGLLPGLGDGAVSLIAGLYLVIEGKHAGLSKQELINIAGRQALDFAMGAIPIVGDIADYFYKANLGSVTLFSQRAEKLIDEARRKGVPEEKLNALQYQSEQIGKVLNFVAENKTIKNWTQHHLNNAIKDKDKS